MQLGTTGAEDSKAKDLIEEAFEQACVEGGLEGCPYCGKRFPVVANIDLDVLWEQLMKVIGVDV